MKIYKYKIELTEDQVVELPVGARILHVGVQREEIFLWAAVSTENSKQDYHIKIVGTGHDVSMSILNYHIATVQQGEFVWHIFGQWDDT